MLIFKNLPWLQDKTCGGRHLSILWPGQREFHVFDLDQINYINQRYYVKVLNGKKVSFI
jgi:hypothetical protein